jgi:hypothetical protein
MSRAMTARRTDISQQLVTFLVFCNFTLIVSYAALSDELSNNGAMMATGLLVFYNILLSWLVIRRSKRQRDRFMLYTMATAMSLLGVSLISRLFL